MRNIRFIFAAFAMAMLFFACQKPEPVVPDAPDDPENENGFVEAVPDTVTFTNSQIIYYGGEARDEISDCWVVKLYTEMELDEVGNPIGPGAVAQLVLSTTYNDQQDADPKMLKGLYREMSNSGDINPGTFISGYMTTIDLPGMTLQLADGTFYADVPSASTTMDYDLIDEGAIRISEGADGVFSIEGVLVGKKYTKRYFKWSGTIEPKVNIPEEIPNSTLTQDLKDLSFTQAQLQDKRDYFYLGDESYRCLLLYLGEDGVDMSGSRPAGNGAVLRLEVLVPWNIDIAKDGIPEGTYTMVTRNLDTSIDKDKIVPGVAIPGLPNVFEAWKVSGSWYYDLVDGVWGETYARIDKGTITIAKDAAGAPVVIYDLEDCQDIPRKIQGQTSLDLLETYPPAKPEEPKVPQMPDIDVNTYQKEGVNGSFASVVVSNLGEYVCIAATPTAGIDDFNAVFEQDEYFYAAVSPLLNGQEFDMMTEDELFTVMSTLEGAELESVAPSMKEEIVAGRCIFDYKEGVADVEVQVLLADGTDLAVRLSAEEPGIVVNQNIFAIAGNQKPVRTAFRKLENGTTALYLTPAGIEYFEDLEISTYYAYIILDDSKCHGRTLTPEDVIRVGYVDNLKGISVDSDDVSVTGTIHVASDSHDLAHYVVAADLDFEGTTLKLRFDGTTRDAQLTEQTKNEVIYQGKSLGITSVAVGSDQEGLYHLMIRTERDDVVRITLPSNFLDGNAHGFSQSPNLYIEYDGVVYSKANGSSGTVTAGIYGDNIRIEATNYNNLEVIYEGPYETEY